MNTNGNYMQNQFCSYEIALKLKELGFDEEVIATFNTEDETLNIFAFSVPNKGIFEQGFKEGWCIKAPLYQQVVDWFREKHNIFISINHTIGKVSEGFKSLSWHYSILDTKDGYVCSSEYDSYDEAREQAILKAIELCQNKK